MARRATPACQALKLPRHDIGRTHALGSRTWTGCEPLTLPASPVTQIVRDASPQSTTLALKMSASCRISVLCCPGGACTLSSSSSRSAATPVVEAGHCRTQDHTSDTLDVSVSPAVSCCQAYGSSASGLHLHAVNGRVCLLDPTGGDDLAGQGYHTASAASAPSAQPAGTRALN